jgi:hypothetical protein
MKRVPVAVTLRDRLGEDGARELNDFVEQHGDAWRMDVVNTCTERFDTRLHDYTKRSDVADGFERIINRLADLRVEILRWSFAFWIGQIVVIAALLRVLLP